LVEDRQEENPMAGNRLEEVQSDAEEEEEAALMEGVDQEGEEVGAEVNVHDEEEEAAALMAGVDQEEEGAAVPGQLELSNFIVMLPQITSSNIHHLYSNEEATVVM
jgi:hypothetical protein